MIIVLHLCKKSEDERCPLIQLNDDGTPRCCGCINDRLDFEKIAEEVSPLSQRLIANGTLN